MATEQVLNWIGGVSTIQDQPPVKLSKTIDNFESDFANGYLFGEILCQYGILENINTFSKKTNKEAKCHNFYQIEDALRYLKIPFDAKLSHQIMSEERGASLRLLYQLKLSLDKHFANGDLTVTALKQKTVDNKVKRVKDLAQSLPKIHKQYGVEGPTFKGENFQRIEKKLLKYEVARVNLEKKAHDDELAEVNMLKSIQQSKRQEAMRKMTENKEFMTEWLADGKANWKKNQDIRAKEIARQLYFEEREIKIYKDMLTNQLNKHTDEMNDGIEDFHENMQKLGIEQNISIQDAIKRQEEKAGIPPGQIQNFSYAATMNKIKETKNNNEFAGKERERRNRKMQVDQRKIQETLDAQKQEEMLIQRLLNKQSQEKNEAYTIWRNDKIKNIVVSNRRNQADIMEEQKLARNAQIEADMKKAAEEAEVQRQDDKEKNAQEYKDIRREQKAKKRHLNIEIASEVLDLIMDVADEAFDYQEQNKNKEGDEKLLTKAIWRDWMSIFTQGKKVSEQNLVINEDEDNKGGVKDSMSLLLQGSSSSTVNPHQLLSDVKNEAVYDDFLQYISMTGPVNLRLVAPDKWHQLKDLVEKDQILASKNIELNFLNELYLPQNKELGLYIEKLYQPKADEFLITTLNSQRDKMTTERSMKQSAVTLLDPKKPSQVVDFPKDHPIKLCILGKAYSGKKTQAQMILNKIGADKVHLFNMNDVIREALNYVDPNQVKEEVVDPKAKGKKTADATPVDIFQGLDTTAYKEVANLLLQQVQLIIGNEESIPGKDTDLVQLFSDDNLLAQLFVHKLKLTFKQGGQSSEEKETAMRDLIGKEKELLEQLEEAKASEGAEVDPKAKGKGKATKSPQEIQDEINQLLAADRSGWILIDFPRNLNQAKQLELMFSGYELPTDGPKEFNQQNFETFTKFTDPHKTTADHFEGEPQAIPSLFDKFFFLNIPKDECFRRATKRKIDPATNTVYHADDNPVPEDPKLAEKLVDYFGNYASEEDMILKIDTNHIQSNDNEGPLKQFIDLFGSYDAESGKGLQTCQEVTIGENTSKETTFQKIEKAIEDVFQFKQIAQDREYSELKEKVRIEEEEKAAAEAKAAQEGADEGEAAEKADEVEPISEVKDKEEAKDENLKVNDGVNSKISLHSRQSANQLSQSKVSSGGMASKKQKRIEYTREFKIKLWEEMETSYIKDGMMTINDIKRQRETVVDNLNQCQRQFIQFLERPDEKQEKVNEFVTSFNKFSLEFPDLRKDDQTKEELLNRLSNLSNTMWDIIEKRKDESIEQIRKMSQGGWSDQEMRFLCRNMASLIEIEIKKFETVYKLQMMSDPPIELDAEITIKKLLDRGAQPYDGTTGVSPVLEQVLCKILGQVDDLISKNPVVQQILHDNQGKILVQERNIFTYRLALIYSWALVTLEEIYVNSRQVYNQLDDWIVEAVSQENITVQQVISFLKQCISSEDLRIEEYQTTIQSLSLMQRIQTIHFSGSEIPLYLRNIHVPSDDIEATRFTVKHLKGLYMEMRFNSGNLSMVDTQSFVNMMTLAFRQGRVPLVWKYNNFEKISNLANKFAILPLSGPNQSNNESPKMYQSKLGLSMSKGFSQQRTWVDWKKVMTYFVLLSSTMPTEKELADLRVKLTDAGEDQFVSKSQFKNISFWFDQFEGKPDRAMEAQWLAEKQQKSENSDEYDSEEEETGLASTLSRNKLDIDRISCLKEILFDVHRVSTGEDKLAIPQFINMFIEASTGVEGENLTFGQLLFASQ